jgi:hypothetical protein
MNALSPRNALREIEWRVVEIAREDGPGSLNPEDFWGRLSRDLFGLPLARKLVNEKLETLRRFCVRAWYCDLLRSRDVRMLMDAGYSSAAVLQILAHVARYRGFTPAIHEQPV